MKNKVTVIIPAYNEEENIAEVIEKVKSSAIKSEIIVVNNCSTDHTEQVARGKGARVVQCHQKGKGYAMEVGLYYAKGQIVVFLDGDIKGYEGDVVLKLCEPILNNTADFVKSSFDRTMGGIVTEIAIKPLLNFLYPDLYKFSEPLSGMIASKKALLQKIELEKDYGVDIGILLDVIKMEARVAEINIGKFENMSHTTKTTESMRNMSSEVMRSILKREKYITEYEIEECC